MPLSFVFVIRASGGTRPRFLTCCVMNSFELFDWSNAAVVTAIVSDIGFTFRSRVIAFMIIVARKFSALSNAIRS